MPNRDSLKALGFGSAGLLAFLLLAVSPAAQIASCRANCEIELAPVVTFGEAKHSSILPWHSIFVSHDSKSDRYFLVSEDLKRVIVFGRQGQVTRILDHRTTGAFNIIAGALVAQDGSLIVYDTMQRSLSTFSSELTPIESRPLRYRPTLLLPESRYLHAAQITTPEHVGQPMHVLDSSGRILRSFGADIDAYRADEPLRHVRVVAPGTDGHIWSAPRGKYLLERWDPSTGRRVAQIAVQSSWFKESARLGSPNERPVPVITALWEVGDTLWVLLRDADTNWRPPEITGERPFELGDYERTFDFVLEAVSITSGVVVATRRFDRALWAREPTFLFATLRQGGAHRTVQVWVPRLVTKERTQ